MNCGASFAKSFIEDIDNKLSILTTMPAIGKNKKVIGNKHYAELVSHPKLIIRYWYNEKELHLIDLKPTEML